MTMVIRHTLNLEDGTPLDVMGVELQEDGAVLLRLDKISKMALSQICNFQAHRAFIVSTDGIDCNLYVERRGADKLPFAENTDEWHRVLLFENEVEAFGLYMFAQLATPPKELPL